MPTDSFATWLRGHLAVQGLSISEVARRYGHSTTIVGHYVHGRHRPSLENIPDFARAINVEPNLLRDQMDLPRINDPDLRQRQAAVAELEELLRPLSALEREAVIRIASETAMQLRRLHPPSEQRGMMQ